MAEPNLVELQTLVRDWLDRHYPAWSSCCLRANVGTDEPLALPILRSTISATPLSASPSPLFVPTDLQSDIMEALQDKTLNADQLAAAVGVSRRSLFRHPGGLRELQEQGIVARHARLGYYLTDSPPEVVAE